MSEDEQTYFQKGFNLKLIDRKVPLARRDALPLVVAADVVLWIPGLPPPRHLRAKPGSHDVLVLEARPIG